MVSQDDFNAYKAKKLAAITELLNGTGTRPVLFLGCGIPRRYTGAPNWIELLKATATAAGIDPARFNFLSQKAGNDPAQIGSLLVDPVHEWAWTTGKNTFPAEYFKAGVDKSIFLKALAAKHLLTFQLDERNKTISSETELMKKTFPHAVITTNFDSLVDDFFPDYEIVVGERIIPMSMSITGELYKIHGTATLPSTLVLTTEDYSRSAKKRRYITSKLMTYFAEYPVFIMGYGLGDSNVNAIISDLGEAMRDKGGLLDNVYFIEWVPDVSALTHLKEEHVVPSESGTDPLRVRAIVTKDFDWILEGLADISCPAPVNIKVLRHLTARVVDLVRVDATTSKVESDYKKIENLSENSDALGMLLGISSASNPNLDYPYILSQVAQKLGFDYWAHAQKLIVAANRKIGYDVKASDNAYHWAFKSGVKNVTHKYSEALVEMLKQMLAENQANSVKVHELPSDLQTDPADETSVA